MGAETVTDPNTEEQVSTEQPSSEEGNGASGEQAGQKESNDFIEFEGAKVSSSAFEKMARERYKDAFDAQSNRDKWQAENTRKAQEVAEKLREAERIIAENEYKRNAPNDQDPYQLMQREYIENAKKMFPDIDERFLQLNFATQMQLANKIASESVRPLQQRTIQEEARQFFARHPDVVYGSPEARKIAEKINQGYDPEDAYELVFKDSRIKSEVEKAIKARDDEAKRKLKQSGPTNQQKSGQPQAKNFSERAMQIIDEMWDK